MTHSALTDVVIHSPNGYFPRSDSIRKVTIHHMAGVLTAEQCGWVFQNTARQASSNYGIGNDGRIGCYLEEENGSWCSSSYANDNQSVTIEVSNRYAGGDWPISDAAWKSMIALCADICTRYGIEPRCDDTVDGSTFTFHRWFAQTGCPGDYIYSRRHQIIEEVKAAMGGTSGEWKHDETGWWFDYGDGTYPADCWKKIEGEWYCFDSGGYMRTGWIWWDGEWYYCKKTSPGSGKMLTGWQTIKWRGKSCRFYFEDGGAMVHDCFMSIKGKWYAFDSDGVLVKDDAEIVVGKGGVVTIL